MKQFYLICNLGLYNAICRIREKSQIFFLHRIKTLVNKIKKYIRKVSVGFAKCHEWRVATLRVIGRAWTGVSTLRVASVAHTVFMTSQLYRRMSVLSVLSRYCWVVHTCRLPPAIPYDTILRLFRSTSSLGNARPCVATASPSVSQRYPSPSTPSFTAELNGSSWRQRRQDIRQSKKIDFK